MTIANSLIKLAPKAYDSYPALTPDGSGQIVCEQSMLTGAQLTTLNPIATGYVLMGKIPAGFKYLDSRIIVPVALDAGAALSVDVVIMGRQFSRDLKAGVDPNTGGQLYTPILAAQSNTVVQDIGIVAQSLLTGALAANYSCDFDEERYIGFYIQAVAVAGFVAGGKIILEWQYIRADKRYDTAISALTS